MQLKYLYFLFFSVKPISCFCCVSVHALKQSSSEATLPLNITRKCYYFLLLWSINNACMCVYFDFLLLLFDSPIC